MAHRLAAEAEVDLDEIWYYVATHATIAAADRLIGASLSAGTCGRQEAPGPMSTLLSIGPCSVMYPQPKGRENNVDRPSMRSRAHS